MSDRGGEEGAKEKETANDLIGSLKFWSRLLINSTFSFKLGVLLEEAGGEGGVRSRLPCRN